MPRFSLSLVCPVKSLRRRGRRLASNWASPSWAEAEMMRGSAIRFSLPYQFEGAPEERLEGRRACHGCLSLPYSGLRGGSRATKVEQRGEDVLIDSVERRGGLRGFFRSRKFVSQLEDHPLGGLLSDARNANELLYFASADVADEIRSRETGEHFHR